MYAITYGLTFIALLITIGAQFFVNSSYKKYNKINNDKNLTGFKAARMILDNNGLNNIVVEEYHGFLSDHYDPTKKVVCLSSNNFNSTSISAVSVAAHECGHAIQDKENYTFMQLRTSLVPLVNISSYAGYIAIILGCILGSLNIIWLGIFAEIIILLFQLITLPVEFNASNRAIKNIEQYNILTKEELKKGKKVLTAAALTYVASVATAIIEILRLIIIYGRRDD